MVAKTIDVMPDSDVAHVLHEVDDEPIILVNEGTRYRVLKERAAQPTGIHEPEGGYDPARFAETLKQIAGAISIDDAESMKAYISAAREAGSPRADEE
jgi:hypothetical protein